ncbi:SUKH-3 domain-containing protein [Thalassoroseus pseudoceratinae]|uniref:SUKH-3 domain-containing protein n=1 Tax=Thalassoroseus pseudoceratinae TaxID=2713176 RepID=UPI0014208F2C|nr:SUKH-3 domain-containing protein [Thalassoroseus pseudoceratinae]
MFELPIEVREWFLECDWTPHHRAAVPDFVPRDHPAYAVLENFGGIKLLERDCSAEDEPIEEFYFRPFSEIDFPVGHWEHRLKSTLIPIAEECNWHSELYIDSAGRCFSNSLIHPCFAFSGESFTDMLVGELQYRRKRPLLPPFEQSVRIYGEEIRRGDPRIWDYTGNR